MKPAILAFSIFFLITLNLFGQTDFKPGYIVKINGDTIDGFISNKGLIKFNNACLFKVQEDSPEIRYTSNDLKGYSFLYGSTYQTKNISSDNNENILFLEVLLNGSVILFYLKDDKEIHYYIQYENSSLIELKNTTTEVVVDDKRFIKQKKEYVGSLKIAFQDTPEILPEVDLVQLNHSSLTKIIIKYHKVTGKEYVIYDDKKVQSSWGFLIGPHFSKVKFVAQDPSYNFVENENFEFMPTYSVSFLYSASNLFGISDKLRFNFLVGYRKNNYESENVTIKQNNLQFPIYLTYAILNKTIKPYFNIGINNLINLNTEITSTRNTEAYKQAVSSFQMTTMLGLGIEYQVNKKHFMLEANYEMGRWFLGNAGFYLNNISSSTSQISIVAGLRHDF